MLTLHSPVVADEPITFVDKIIVNPPSQSVDIKTDLEIRVGRFFYGDPTAYKFVLMQLQTNDGVRQWQPVMRSDSYPLPLFISEYEGPSALQLNIYLKKDTSQVQHIWLGNYFFHSGQKNYPSLARAFFADMFDNTLSESFIQLAEQLSFFTYIKTDNIHACKPDCTVTADKKRLFEFGNKTPRVDATFNFTKNKPSFVDGIISNKESGIGIFEARYPQYDEILKRLEKLSVYKKLDEKAQADVVLSAFAVQMYHRGYQSGTPETGYLYSLQQPLSMCNLYSYQLIRTLEQYEIDTNFISYVNEFGGAHAFVEVKIQPDLFLLLDAMQGTIYFGNVADVSTGKRADEFDLPKYQDFAINLNSELKSAKNIYFSDDISLSRGQAGHSKDFITIR